MDVDESMVTGEAQRLGKVPGSAVIAGSINGSGILTVLVHRLPDDNTISEIARMVDEAKFSKPKVLDMADRVASYFVPVVVVLALITFCIWVAVRKAIRNEASSTAVVNAITYAIAALTVSCPYAIGLAVPMVIVISGGVAASHGLIFKTAEMIEIARSVDHVVFDKTGTLTKGQMAVVEELYLAVSKESTAALVLGMTTNIKHPVSHAVAKHLQNSNIESYAVHDIQTLPGIGVQGSWNGSVVRAGNSRWLAVTDQPLVKNLLARGLTVFCVMEAEELIAIYGLKDCIRSDAGSVVSELKRRGIIVSIVSGDDHGAVAAVAAKLEIPTSRVRSRCSPAEKRQYIKHLTLAYIPVTHDYSDLGRSTLWNCAHSRLS